jgi:N-acetylmuramoyl-L-alanine amidase
MPGFFGAFRGPVSFGVTMAIRRASAWDRRQLAALLGLLLGVVPSVATGQLSPLHRPGESAPIVVLDPGHGGDESGVRGPTGLLEKDIALEVATEAARLIEQLLGFRTVLTRRDDVDVPLETRAAIANQAGGDLFISLHAGGSFTPARRPFQTFYFDDLQRSSPPRRDDARSRARPARGGRGPLSLGAPPPAVPWDEAQFDFLDASQTLARLLYNNLRAQLAEEGRGVFGLPLLVLRWVRMPAVVVDLGSLSDPTFESQLRDDTYLQRVALGIAQAVNDFHALQR